MRFIFLSLHYLCNQCWTRCYWRLSVSLHSVVHHAISSYLLYSLIWSTLICYYLKDLVEYVWFEKYLFRSLDLLVCARVCKYMLGSALVHKDLDWFLRICMGPQGSSLVLKDLHGSIRICMGQQRSALVLKDLDGSTRICTGSQGSAWVLKDLHGFLRICMGPKGSVRVQKDLYGSTRIYMGLQGYGPVLKGLYWFLRICNPEPKPRSNQIKAGKIYP